MEELQERERDGVVGWEGVEGSDGVEGSEGVVSPPEVLHLAPLVVFPLLIVK